MTTETYISFAFSALECVIPFCRRFCTFKEYPARVLLWCTSCIPSSLLKYFWIIRQLIWIVEEHMYLDGSP